jgi:hypothetical protein
MKRLMLVLSIFGMLGFVLGGCKKDKPADQPPGDEAKKDEPKPEEPKPDEPKKDEPKKDEAKKDEAKAEGGDKVGVPECDEYISKYEKCIGDKVPEAARAQMKSAFDQMKDAWRKAAATPEGKTGLATGCKMAMDAAKKAMAAYKCDF